MRARKILQILLLPFLDAIVLGLIVGGFIIDIDRRYNATDYDGILTGEDSLVYPATMFLLYWVPVFSIVLVVELVIHYLVRAIGQSRHPRLNS